MTRGIWITGAVVAALAMSAVAVSAHGYGRDGAHAEMMFETLDADGDGRVTPEEVTAHHAARFAAADADGDGLLSAEEMQAARDAQHANRAERMIARMDTDDDGLLSLEEMQGRRDPARMFERLDANADGAITAEEFEDARGKYRHLAGGHHGGEHGHGRGQDND